MLIIETHSPWIILYARMDFLGLLQLDRYNNESGTVNANKVRHSASNYYSFIYSNWIYGWNFLKCCYLPCPFMPFFKSKTTQKCEFVISINSWERPNDFKYLGRTQGGVLYFHFVCSHSTLLSTYITKCHCMHKTLFIPFTLCLTIWTIKLCTQRNYYEFSSFCYYHC